MVCRLEWQHNARAPGVNDRAPMLATCDPAEDLYLSLDVDAFIRAPQDLNN